MGQGDEVGDGGDVMEVLAKVEAAVEAVASKGGSSVI